MHAQVHTDILVAALLMGVEWLGPGEERDSERWSAGSDTAMVRRCTKVEHERNGNHMQMAGMTQSSM